MPPTDVSPRLRSYAFCRQEVMGLRCQNGFRFSICTVIIQTLSVIKTAVFFRNCGFSESYCVPFLEGKAIDLGFWHQWFNVLRTVAPLEPIPPSDQVVWDKAAPLPIQHHVSIGRLGRPYFFLDWHEKQFSIRPVFEGLASKTSPRDFLTR